MPAFRHLPGMVGSLALIWTISGSPVRLVAQTDLERIRAGTVKITVNRTDGTQETGAGLVIGLRGNRVYVLTANHVVEGSGTIQVMFYEEPAVPFPASVINREESLDLAAVLVNPGPSISPADMPKFGVRDSNTLRELEDVTSLGHPGDATWRAAPNKIVELDKPNRPGLFSFTKNGIERGFSGAGNFDNAGLLIGITTETSASTASAVKMDDAIRVMGVWRVPMDQIDPASRTPSLPQTREQPASSSNVGAAIGAVIGQIAGGVAPPASVPRGEGLSGNWEFQQGDNDFGTLLLRQQGSNLTGELHWNSRAGGDVFVGVVEGDMVEFKVRYQDGVVVSYYGMLNASKNGASGYSLGRGVQTNWQSARKN